MTNLVVATSLALAVVLFAAGIVDLVETWSARKDTKDAIKAAATVGKTANASAATLEAQSKVDFSGAWTALASLATALKDLDRSSRLFMIALAFLAVAAAGAGIDAVADAVSG